MTSIKKQAVRDANELFDYYESFWTKFDAIMDKCDTDSKYNGFFSGAYYPMVDKLNEARFPSTSAVPVNIPEAVVEPVKRRGLSINKTFVAGVLIGIAVHETELDKYVVAKVKSTYKRLTS